MACGTHGEGPTPKAKQARIGWGQRGLGRGKVPCKKEFSHMAAHP